MYRCTFEMKFRLKQLAEKILMKESTGNVLIHYVSTLGHFINFYLMKICIATGHRMNFHFVSQ